MRNERHFVVLGGAGTIGRTVVRDLFESCPENRIVIADYKQAAAQSLAESLDKSRVEAKFADARCPEEIAQLLKGKSVVINCLQHTFNLAIMKAALSAGVHYVDLGGLFYWTRRQLRLDKEFLDAGLTAVIGMGCAPGITNLLAARVVNMLGKVQSLKIRVGARDFKPPENKFGFPYSPQTIVEELTLSPYVFSNGKLWAVKPRTGWELTEFPIPLGKVWTLWTRHSEIATLPWSLRNAGLKYCDFKVSFDRQFVAEVMKRLRNGWTLQQLNELVVVPSKPNDCEISRVTADNWNYDCYAWAKPEWQASAGDVDTACPASIAAQMIAVGAAEYPGVAPPEIAVPFRLFFKELEKRGMKLKINQKPD